MAHLRGVRRGHEPARGRRRLPEPTKQFVQRRFFFFFASSDLSGAPERSPFSEVTAWPVLLGASASVLSTNGAGSCTPVAPFDIAKWLLSLGTVDSSRSFAFSGVSKSSSSNEPEAPDVLPNILRNLLRYFRANMPRVISTAVGVRPSTREPPALTKMNPKIENDPANAK